MFVIGIGQIKLEVVKNKILIGIYDILSFIIEPLNDPRVQYAPVLYGFPKTKSSRERLRAWSFLFLILQYVTSSLKTSLKLLSLFRRCWPSPLEKLL